MWKTPSPTSGTSQSARYGFSSFGTCLFFPLTFIENPRPMWYSIPSETREVDRCGNRSKDSVGDREYRIDHRCSASIRKKSGPLRCDWRWSGAPVGKNKSARHRRTSQQNHRGASGVIHPAHFVGRIFCEITPNMISIHCGYDRNNRSTAGVSQLFFF